VIRDAGAVVLERGLWVTVMCGEGLDEIRGTRPEKHGLVIMFYFDG
jgi:hypothetical protein